MVRMKKFTDLSLGFYSDGSLLTHPSKLRTFDEESSPRDLEIASKCHIYLILSRPRAEYVPDSITYDGERIKGILRFSVLGVVTDVGFSLVVGLGYTVEPVQYPFNSMRVNGKGGVWFSMPAYLMSLYANLDSDNLLKMEVEYVGMSYADGRRSAKDRLLSHSTLQAVLADMSHDFPDKEVLLLLQEFAAPQVIMVMNSKAPGATIEADRDVIGDLNRAKEEISEDLQIALIEAGLIKYFQPSYNEKYKERFPHYSHKILDEVYSIDFGGLSVEIDTEHLNFKLFSPTRGIGYHHIAAFDLHNIDISASFFNTFNTADGPSAKDFSGPLY